MGTAVPRTLDENVRSRGDRRLQRLRIDRRTALFCGGLARASGGSKRRHRRLSDSLRAASASCAASPVTASRQSGLERLAGRDGQAMAAPGPKQRAAHRGLLADASVVPVTNRTRDASLSRRGIEARAEQSIGSARRRAHRGRPCSDASRVLFVTGTDLASQDHGERALLGACAAMACSVRLQAARRPGLPLMLSRATPRSWRGRRADYR